LVGARKFGVAERSKLEIRNAKYGQTGRASRADSSQLTADRKKDERAGEALGAVNFSGERKKQANFQGKR
jgi:hypothetical protein